MAEHAVVVAGGGPTGLMLAGELAMAGAEKTSCVVCRKPAAKRRWRPILAHCRRFQDESPSRRIVLFVPLTQEDPIVDASHFDRVARWFGASPSRRHLLSLMLAGVLGVRGTGDAEGKKQRRKKNKKIKRNAFGCVNVGKFCKRARQCCSGICKGKKGKKKCKAHDTGGCKAGQSNGDCGGVNVTCQLGAGLTGVCDTTTGKAGYCGVGGGGCFACAKDADCQPFCGPQAACIVCSDACAGTACFGPGACTFPPP